MLGMKWVAYAKTHVEGYDYYLSYGFEIPSDLYEYLLNEIMKKHPLYSCARYKELQKYAEIALDYCGLSGFYDEFLTLQAGEDENEESLWESLKEYNENRKRINVEVCYIRVLDPSAQELFVEYCSELEISPNCRGKKRTFDYFYYDKESFTWEIQYSDEENSIEAISSIKSSVSVGEYKDYVKFCNGEHSVYPPYEDIIKDLKRGVIYSKLE